jgi:ribosomal protein L29
MKLRFQHATAQLDSHAKIKVARRDIARMKTELGSRNRKARKAQG